MSKEYAVLKDNVIHNIVIAESLEVAEQITGLQCYEITPDNPAEKGWDFDTITGKAIIPRQTFEIAGVMYYVDFENDELIPIENGG